MDPASERRLLDPTGELEPGGRIRPPRLDGFEGRTVGLLDISKPRGDLFLDTIESSLRARGADVVRYRKPTFTKPAPADLRQEIAERCDAAIEALAD